MNFIGFMERNFNIKYSAYTLAEMLIVLVIVAIVMISLPPATKKLFTVKEVKTYHGRYECYWDNSGILRYYYAKERPGMSPEIKEGPVNPDNPEAATKCEFVPPLTYPYLMIHAVGGGGAGGNITETVQTPNIRSVYTEYLPGQEWSAKWFVNFMDGLSNSEKNSLSIDDKDVYSTMLTYRQVTLDYRKSGGAGAVSSMFFPFIPNGNKFYLYPGKGGELKAQNENGGDGGNTVVQIVKTSETCDVTDSNAPCNIIFAQGGKGATVLGSDNQVIELSTNIQLTGGKLSDQGISNYSDVKGNPSGFSNIIDKINKQEALSTHVSSNAGDGGNGGNHFIKDSLSGFYYHEFDDFKTGNCYTDGIERTCKGGELGVNWLQVSDKVNAHSVYSQYCENKSSNLSSNIGGLSGGFWITRSAKGDITTQCKPNTNSNPYYFYCTVGYMKRTFTPTTSTSSYYAIQNCQNACDTSNKGRCACYIFVRGSYSYNSSLGRFAYSYNLYNDVNNPTNNGFVENGKTVASYYRNPVFTLGASDNIGYMTVEEHIPDNSKHIYCSMSSEYAYGSSPCENNNNFDTAKGICKASKGGNGAIVILW